MTDSKPLRVCFVAGNIYPLLAERPDLPIVGGAEVQQHAIATELMRHGVEVSFVAEDFGQGALTRRAGAEIHAYTFGRDKLRQGLTLWRALNRSRADVYYLRGMPKFLPLLLLHSASRGLPLVLGMSTNQMTHPRRSTGLSRPQHLAYRWALRRAAAVVAQTEPQRVRLAENYGVRNAVVIPNGAPSPDPFVEPAGRSGALPAERGRTVVWLATLLPYKGVEHLFELAARCPGLSFAIHGGPGRGHAAYYEEMRTRAAELPNVAWHGPLLHRNVDAALAGALAFVNTTTAYQGVADLEGFPNVYLEAWRNGVPTLTLANDPDGVIERNGLGHHSRTVEQMALELEALSRNPGRRARLDEATRAYVAREHDLTRIGTAYLELFRRVAGRT